MIKRWLIVIFVLLSGSSISFSQQGDTCKVLKSEISGAYQGDCKNGLADGKGTAKGEDTYIGMFKNGLPDGKGKYTYKNGNVFTGRWSKGFKNGEGKFLYFVNGTSYTQKGYWVNGEYVGTSNPEELYRVTNSAGIEYYTIKKVEGDEKQIIISFVGAMTKYVPRDVEINISSGQLKQEIKNFVVYLYTCPVNCSIHFTIKTLAGDRQCNFMFDILKPGKYEVQITNS